MEESASVKHKYIDQKKKNEGTVYNKNWLLFHELWVL